MRGMGGSLARPQRRSPVFGHHGSSSPTAANSPAGTPPHGPGAGLVGDLEGVAGPINSILLPVNQRYLASKGYYRQQGWPRGTYVEPEEDPQAAGNGEESRASATSRRKMFQKTRSQRQNWSLCESGEKENGALGGIGEAGADASVDGEEIPRTSSSARGEWFTKSMDDSLSQDEGVRARIDSVGQNTFFSTTTEESSTDSLDAGGSDTERALEEIRRQYHESQKPERKESEELFFPRRRSDMKASFGDFLGSSAGVFQEEESEENAEEVCHKGSVRGKGGGAVGSELDRNRISSDGDDEGAGGSYLLPDDNNHRSSNNYFISPVSSRQTTVEKSPTLHGSNDDDFVHHDGDHNTNDSNNNEDDKNNNSNNNNGNNNSRDEKGGLVEANNRTNLKEHGEEKDSGEVRIIVSSFSSGSIVGKSWQSSSKSSSVGMDAGKAGNAATSGGSGSSNSNKLTVERAQQASSDSGSSSSGGTAVGLAVSSTDADTDGATPRNFLSEESDGITDRDSISRTHSPCGFPPSRPGSGGRGRSQAGHRFAQTTSCCQTSEADFITAAQAEMGEAVNATVRQSSARATSGISAGQGQGRYSSAGGADVISVHKDGELKPPGAKVKRSGRELEDVADDTNEEGKVRLSALPTSINPLELMRRLRHSQDEMLLRTGSVQSDSSGFGDADPTPDSGHSEGDQPKVSSLGSSHDSGDTTLAGSSSSQQHHKLLQLQQQHHQPARGEMATQTNVESATSSSSSTAQPDVDSEADKKSLQPNEDHNSFITTCFIPSLNPDGLRHRRGGQHQPPPPPQPQPPHSYLLLQQQQQYQQHQQQQQQQQHYTPLHQRPPLYIDPQNSRLSASGHRSEISLYLPVDHLQDKSNVSSYPYASDLYHPGYEPPVPHSADYASPPHHQPYRSFHEAHNPYQYPHYEDPDSSYYPRSRSQSRSYRSAMSDSEWSGYADRDYFGQSYCYDYNYNYPPPPPPQHRRFFQRHRSLDYTGFLSDRADYNPDLNYDGYVNSDREGAAPSRRYRSQLELFTTGTGRVASQPGSDLRQQHRQQKSFTRGRSEEGMLATAGAGGNLEEGPGRNQMPLSEELAAAMAGGKTALETSSSSTSATSSAQNTPVKHATSSSSTLFSSSTTIVPTRPHGDSGSGNSRGSLVSSIVIPRSSTVTLTPEVSKLGSDANSSGPSPNPQTTPQGNSHISGQNLPALAGNLRNLPQGLYTTPVKQTTIVIATSSSSSTSSPSVALPQTSTPMVSATAVPITETMPVMSVNPSSSSASSSAFKSRKQKSCDILDNDDDNDFSDGDPLSVSSQQGGIPPPSSSASFVSHLYYESKGGGGGGMGSSSKEGPVVNIAVASPFTSQPPSYTSGSSSLRHRPAGPHPPPSRQSRYPYPAYHGYPPPHPRTHSSSSSSLPPMPYSGPHPLSFSRGSDDMEGYYSSSMAESSSDFSFRSTPEWGGRAGILNSRKLARLINQPVYFKGNRRPGCNYRPRRLFKEWAMLSKRKRLQEENRLLQHTLHKYKTELGLMETTLKMDYQSVLPDMTEEEREQLACLEWLWSEVKGQVSEMEQLLLSRIKSVQSGNDFHSLLANLGVINKITELIKEQIYQQKVISSRAAEAEEEEEEEEDNDSFNPGDDRDIEFEDTPDDLEMFDDEFTLHQSHGHYGDGFWEGRNRSYHGRPSHPAASESWIAGVGPASTPRFRSQSSTGKPRSQVRSSSSTSNLPQDLNVSLEQMKSSLLSQMQQEIKDSTRKLELDLQAKDREIQELKNQIGSSSRSAQSTPDLTYRSVARIYTNARSQPATPRGHDLTRKRSRSRSRMMGDRIVQETDV